MHLNDLIKALQNTEKDVCLRAANRLTSLGGAPATFDLHLRHANLDDNDAINIADALSNSSVTLGSFSASFNPGLQEHGAIALINSLPKTVAEIGMVGCGLSDESGKVLLDWAGRAVTLRMLCVEQNHFTTEMRQKISDLCKNKDGLMVVV